MLVSPDSSTSMNSGVRDWYRRRAYAHFDRPLSEEEALRLVTSPERVATHAFWPVILNPRRSVSRRATDGARQRAVKRRPIGFCAHSDAHIFSFYARDLEQRLEDIYRQRLGNNVLAYRKLAPRQCNIHFAQKAFEEAAFGRAVDVVAIDVEGFFDALKHDVLKSAWACLLGGEHLPPDHFAVFKACTRDTAVTLPELRNIFAGEVRRRAGRTGVAICSPSEFRERVVPRLEPRHKLVRDIKQRLRSPNRASPSPATGIPQGLPISAVLANVYMLSTDEAIASSIAALGGSYRRYSDDILLIGPQGFMADAENLVCAALKRVGLEVNANKTERHRLRTQDGTITSFALDAAGKELCASPCSYLGLSFDGTHVRIRSSTISSFMIKARRAIARAKSAAKGRGEKRIKRRLLYARLTSLGYGSAYGENDERLRRPRNAPQLGFFKYLKLAERITDSGAIEQQRRQLESQIFRWLDNADRELEESR